MAGRFGRFPCILFQHRRGLLNGRLHEHAIRCWTRLCSSNQSNAVIGGVSNRGFSSTKPLPQKESVTIHFLLPDGTRKSANAKLGDSLLDVVTESNLDLDGYGACEGTLACSTCHIALKEEDFKENPEKPSDEELDMLDLAYGLTDTSRLGCQIIVTKAMDGWEVKVPAGFADARS